MIRRCQTLLKLFPNILFSSSSLIAPDKTFGKTVFILPWILNLKAATPFLKILWFCLIGWKSVAGSFNKSPPLFCSRSSSLSNISATLSSKFSFAPSKTLPFSGQKCWNIFVIIGHSHSQCTVYPGFYLNRSESDFFYFSPSPCLVRRSIQANFMIEMKGLSEVCWQGVINRWEVAEHSERGGLQYFPVSFANAAVDVS